MSAAFADSPATYHATTVSHAGSAVMIEGPAGSGKSSLALQLMALGAVLIADDATCLAASDGCLWASAPDTLPAAIEARGIGLLTATLGDPAPLRLIIDLRTTETDRMPPRRYRALQGHKIILLHNVDGAHFPAAIMQYLKGGGTMTP